MEESGFDIDALVKKRETEFEVERLRHTSAKKRQEAERGSIDLPTQDS